MKFTDIIKKLNDRSREPLSIETNSPEETLSLGIEIGKNAAPGSIYTLDGELGTGKTVLAQGIARGLGIEENVCSPTFTIMEIHEGGRLALYHFDVYRIADPDEMYEIGFDEFLFGNGVTLVEWSTLIEELIPKEAIRIGISKEPEKGFDYRKITIKIE